MNIPVDVVAIFNTQGNIKPTFIRVENEDHSLSTYKVEKIQLWKEEKYTGIYNIVYVCDVLVDKMLKQVKLSYNLQSHKWVLYQL